MKNAYISIVDSRDGLEKAHSLLIDQWYEGISDYKPLCTAQLVYLKGEGFLARLYCREAEPRVTVACEDGPVYKDSCLEWFCNFAPERSDIYMNMEVNAAGRMLCRLGSGRQNRQPLPDTAPRPRVCASREEGGWSLELFVPLATVKAVWGKENFASGDTIKANFYKCGDETEHLHYGMWSRCETEKPDFHRPEFFGTLVIVE